MLRVRVAMTYPANAKGGIGGIEKTLHLGAEWCFLLFHMNFHPLFWKNHRTWPVRVSISCRQFSALPCENVLVSWDVICSSQTLENHVFQHWEFAQHIFRTQSIFKCLFFNLGLPAWLGESRGLNVQDLSAGCGVVLTAFVTVLLSGKVKNVC